MGGGEGEGKAETVVNVNTSTPASAAGDYCIDYSFTHVSHTLNSSPPTGRVLGLEGSSHLSTVDFWMYVMDSFHQDFCRSHFTLVRFAILLLDHATASAVEEGKGLIWDVTSTLSIIVLLAGHYIA